MNDPGDPPTGPNRTIFRPSPLQATRGQQPGTIPPAGPGQAPPARSAPLPADDIPPPPVEPTARNPMTMAAGPLLALAASIRSGRVAMAMPDFHGKASAELTRFDQALAPFYDEETRRRASYALAATLDDIAQNLPGQAADGAEWARRSLVVQTFRENIGGDRFWQIVDDMLARPQGSEHLIELYHACLAAGFEGRFRIMPDGKSRLHEIMSRLYAGIAHARALSQSEFAPRWQGVNAPARRPALWSRLAFAAAIAAALLLLAYIGFRVMLAQTGAPALDALAEITPEQPLRLSRAAAPPPQTQTPQLDRLRAFLAPEIAERLVAVEADGTSVRVRTTVGELFQSGSEQLSAGRGALIERIGRALEAEQGPITVEGHADSDRVSNLTFPSNFALSQARADTVADILRRVVSDGSRISSKGFGDSQPIASNATAAGKAQNRRVEIAIPRAD